MRNTGPAQEHRKGKILPTHNILKPGAHPKHAAKKNDHKPEHHESGTIDDLPKPKKID